MTEYRYLEYDEFMDLIRTMPCQDYVVRVRYRYDWEDIWTESNEVLEYYPCNDARAKIHDDYVWLNDWFEGQQWVEIMGFMPVDEVKVKERKVPK